MSARSGEDSDAQVIEEFWGVELTKEKKVAKWDAEDEEEDDSLFISNNLELRQACLGVGAKEGERNVVQVTVGDGTGETSTFTILSLRVGGTEQSTLFLNMQPPVTFKLVEGSGPVHIVGQTTETMNNFLGDSDDESDEEDGEQEAGTLAPAVTSKKRPATSTTIKPPSAKVAKREADVSMEGSLTKSGTDDPEEEDEEDDDEDDDEEDDDDEDDEDEDEEDEDEDDEEEEEVKPVPKKTQINGKSKTPVKGGPTKANGSKTPQHQQKSSKWQQKSSASVPSKTSSDRKKSMTKVPDLNDIKQRLTKMSVPKKLDKFNNFISNSFKIKDDNVKKELWEHIQKSRPLK